VILPVASKNAKSALSTACSRRGSRRPFRTPFSTAVPDAVLPPPSLGSYLPHPWARHPPLRGPSPARGRRRNERVLRGPSPARGKGETRECFGIPSPDGGRSSSERVLSRPFSRSRDKGEMDIWFALQSLWSGKSNGWCWMGVEDSGWPSSSTQAWASSASSGCFRTPSRTTGCRPRRRKIQ
jgi:hypothetical protein